MLRGAVSCQSPRRRWYQADSRLFPFKFTRPSGSSSRVTWHFTSAHHLILDPRLILDPSQSSVLEMATSVHGDGEEQAGEAEPGEDGYWPALEILGEKRHEYLVNWDGTDPETGLPWTPTWTRKTEVTDDLIEAWKEKQAAKKKKKPPGMPGFASPKDKC